MNMLEDSDVLVCEQYQNVPIHTKVNRVKPTKGIQNQELLNNKEVSPPRISLFCLICTIFSVFMLPMSQRVSS